MEATTKNSEECSVIPGVQAKGTTTACNDIGAQENKNVCHVPDEPCNYRKGYMCGSDCECLKDPEGIRAYQDREFERITSTPRRRARA